MSVKLNATVDQIELNTNKIQNFNLDIENNDSEYPSVNAVKKSLSNLKKEFIDLFYPVGSIYTCINDLNPQERFPDTQWVPWGSGCVPVGVNINDSNFNVVEKTGGASTHTLTIEQMPSHTHTQDAHTHIQTAHTHPAGSSSTNPYFFSYSTTHEAEAMSSISGSDYKVPRIPTTHTISDTTTIRSATAINNNTVATNNNTGGSQSHNNLQPYITCYMWKRIA